MKNYDEFRQTVFDKAKKYEARRKARNKKIIESVSLCSLVIVITLSAYLGILSFPEQLTESSSETTTASSATSTMTEETSATTATSSNTTTVQPSQTATESTLNTPPQIEWTTTETTREDIGETEQTFHSGESTEIPSISKLEFRGTAKETNTNIGETVLVEIETFKEWQDFREANLDDYPNLKNNADDLDDEYFEKHTLVVVQYTGYDVVAFEYHFIPTLETDETYVLQITLRKNPKNRREQIHVMSVEKDVFQYAEIRVLDK